MCTYTTFCLPILLFMSIWMLTILDITNKAAVKKNNVQIFVWTYVCNYVAITFRNRLGELYDGYMFHF